MLPSETPADVTASASAIDCRSTRERILDAAEELFARQGYFAATIRGITRAADVELSLSRYYFGSKDELFRQVVARRADTICTMLDASLVLVSQGRRPDVRDVVEAMIGPATERLASGDPGWRNYLRLLAGFGLLNERHDLLRPWRERYAPTAARYRSALSSAMPDAPEAVVSWGLHFLHSLLGHALLDVGVTRYVGGEAETPVQWSELREQLIRHVVGGLRAQAEG